ncbi:HlyD family secretion protein [Dongia deserti]|uniref:HlyD family secretion protein n=1 Tax=Dongia deserti TaxID=2268030 RepID=UPI0025495ADA|nr:HlyD family secretion protein [Dongia deserti]
MSVAETTEPTETAMPTEATKSHNPVRRWVAIILLICVILFGYSLIADRLTPYTPQGIVQAFVVAIAPEVPGRIVEVAVEDNQKVEAGQLLFRVDPEPYEIAREKAMADVAAAGQSIGADTAGVSAAQAKVVEAQANLTNVMEQTARTQELVKKGVFAKARGDQAKAERDAAKAKFRQAQAEQRQAEEALGPQGADNPQLRASTAAQAKAERDLIRTMVNAPTPGLVTNLQLTLGQFAAAGQPVMTFIDARSYWVIASFRENNLENVKPGDAVDIVFDALPGEIFPGTVESIGWGVSNYNSGNLGALPTIRNQSSWIRDPQRFPVRIELDAEKYVPGLRHGSQANVIVYTGENGLVNAVGRAWIWLVSILTYAT